MSLFRIGAGNAGESRVPRFSHDSQLHFPASLLLITRFRNYAIGFTDDEASSAAAEQTNTHPSVNRHRVLNES